MPGECARDCGQFVAVPEAEVDAQAEHWSSRAIRAERLIAGADGIVLRADARGDLEDGIARQYAALCYSAALDLALGAIKETGLS